MHKHPLRKPRPWIILRVVLSIVVVLLLLSCEGASDDDDYLVVLDYLETFDCLPGEYATIQLHGPGATLEKCTEIYIGLDGHIIDVQPPTPAEPDKEFRP